MGYLLAPENLTEKIRRAYQFMAFSANTPIQHAYAEILKRPDLYLSLGAFYQAKRDLFREGLKASKFKLLDCKGSYFQSVAYDQIADLSDVEMANYLTQEKGVAAIPVSAFYLRKTDHRVLRFCFAKTDETLNKALDILCKL
jgi:methionine aminotransferase